MPYEPVEVDRRMTRKDEAFLHHFSQDDEAFRESEKEALESMKATHNRLKKESVVRYPVFDREVLDENGANSGRLKNKNEQ